MLKKRRKMKITKKYVFLSVLISTVLFAVGSAYAAPLYFPHVDTTYGWQTEIAIINTSTGQSVTGTLRALSNTGQQIDTKAVTLPAHGRIQITVANEFTNHTSIGYIIFESDSNTIQGYTKFYIDGVYRVAIPAVKELNTGDIYITHIDSSIWWWTGISLVNTNSTAKTLTITFNDGQTKQIPLAANEHRAFAIRDLFNNQPQPAIKSGVISNASGVIGLELFGSFLGGSQLEGLLLTDKTAFTLYYPHVQGGDWWTGIVAYNPSQVASGITITPFNAQGTPLTASTDSIGGKSKYVGTVTGLGLPDQTAWFKIDSTRPLRGFELVSSNDFEQLAGYSGHGGAVAMAGVFPTLEKSGSTVITLVNTEDKAATVTFTFYNDAGKALLTQEITIGSRAKMNGTVVPGNATYLAYSSDRNMVAAQINGSADWTMLDGLPGLATDTTTPMDAATVIDAPNTVVASENVSATGNTITTEDATLVVPQDAVEQDTKIEIRRLEKRFNMNPYATDKPDAISAIPIGWAMDFGPAGVKFNKPVTITIPYDPDALTDKHRQPALAYWNGTEWLVLDCAVDPEAHTVSVRLESFDGIALTAIAVGAVTAGIWIYTAIKWMAHDDPILAKKAAEYVTPNDPGVKAAAAQATIDNLPITDEASLAKHLESLNGKSSKILFGNIGKVTYTMTTGANWQKPSDYFSSNPTGENYDGDKALGKMRGDCTDMANASVSMFRSLGYQAKSVFGYNVDKDSPHNWAEVIVGGVAYFIDERGGIQRLEEAMTAQKIIRPDADDSRNFMWDETGQIPYEKEWWKKALVIKEITIVRGESIFSGGSLGSYRGVAVAQGLTDFGAIPLDSAGNFSIIVPQAKAKFFLLWPDIQTTAEMTNLVLNGNWDQNAKKGTVSLTCAEHILMIDWGQGNDGTKDGTYNRITEDYTFTYNASGEIKLVEGNVHFILETQWSRTGNKTEARVVVQNGQATVVGTPTVTDMSRTDTGGGTFYFTYK